MKVHQRKSYCIRNMHSKDLIQFLIEIEAEIKESLRFYRNADLVFYLTPGAYARLFPLASDIPRTSFKRGRDIDVGELLGCPCKSTIFKKDKDYFGMTNYSFCYQIEEIE